MKSLLVAALLVVFSVSAFTQVSVRLAPSAQQDEQTISARISEAYEMIQRYESARKINDAVNGALGGLPLVADRVDVDSTGKIVHASGNVSIRMNEVIIKARRRGDRE